MNNGISPGLVVELTAPADVLSGQAIQVGQIFGTVVADALSGQPMQLEVTGIQEITKKTTDTFAEGALAYWDAANSRLTSTATSNLLVGAAVKAAGNTDTILRIRLNGIARANEAGA